MKVDAEFVAQTLEEAKVEGLSRVSASDVEDAAIYAGDSMDEFWRILRGYNQTLDYEAEACARAAEAQAE